jgi:predicted porin
VTVAQQRRQDRIARRLGAAGRAKVLTGIARTKVEPGDTRTTTTVGYDCTRSKRTDVYAMLRHDSITNFQKGDSFGVGVRHNF